MMVGGSPTKGEQAMAFRVSAQVVVTGIFESARTPMEAVAAFVADQGFSTVEAAAEHEGLSIEEFVGGMLIDDLGDELTA
jgi:hypothetical protein